MHEMTPADRPPAFISTPLTLHVLGFGEGQARRADLSFWEEVHLTSATEPEAEWRIDPTSNVVGTAP